MCACVGGAGSNTGRTMHMIGAHKRGGRSIGVTTEHKRMGEFVETIQLRTRFSVLPGASTQHAQHAAPTLLGALQPHRHACLVHKLAASLALLRGLWCTLQRMRSMH